MNNKTTQLLSLLLIAILISCNKTERTPVLHMIGDSTMANKTDLDYPERGWGQVLPEFFDSSLTIMNYSRNGRSSRSFIYESRWDTVYSKIQPGDYVVVQFGHNDDVETKIGRHSTLEEYEYNLSKFVRETLEKGAEPILCTPIVRRNFVDSVLVETHGEYPDVVRNVANKFDVMLVDMHIQSRELVKNLGVEDSKPIYLHLPADKYKKAPDGKIDNTHFSGEGARKMASFFVDHLSKTNHELAKYIKE
ncbi:MAG: rhamnogalacturonan acetylesterase [Prolixibacteraceae bacterium]|jgi:lysophospholipase L1-like esterase|nr:rhamnogalacturonan acetylesterase [Prolixibacteraceae bacterium]